MDIMFINIRLMDDEIKELLENVAFDILDIYLLNE